MAAAAVVSKEEEERRRRRKRWWWWGGGGWNRWWWWWWWADVCGVDVVDARRSVMCGPQLRPLNGHSKCSPAAQWRRAGAACALRWVLGSGCCCAASRDAHVTCIRGMRARFSLRVRFWPVWRRPVHHLIITRRPRLSSCPRRPQGARAAGPGTSEAMSSIGNLHHIHRRRAHAAPHPLLHLHTSVHSPRRPSTA